MSTARAAMNGSDAAAVSPQLDHFKPRRHVPETDCLVVAAAGQALTIGRPGEAVHPAGMAAQRADLAPRLRLPEFDSAVETGAGEEAAIGRKGQAADGVRVSNKVPDDAMARQFQQMNLDVLSANCEELAIR